MLKDCIPIVHRRLNTVSRYPQGMLLLKMCSIRLVDTFPDTFSKNRLIILGFHSDNLLRKTMKNKKYWRKFESLENVLYDVLRRK